VFREKRVGRAQAVSCRPPTGETPHLGSVHLGFVVNKVVLGQVFPLSVSLYRYSITRKNGKN
jgi:hypothetical protein